MFNLNDQQELVHENSNVQERLAQALSEKVPTNDEVSRKRKELREATMKHPISGKTIKQAYFGESLVNHGLTLMEWIESNFVAIDKYEELEREYRELSKKLNKRK